MTSKKKKPKTNNTIGSVIPSKHLPSVSGKWHGQLAVQEHMDARLVLQEYMDTCLTVQGRMDARITVQGVLMLH